MKICISIKPLETNTQKSALSPQGWFLKRPKQVLEEKGVMKNISLYKSAGSFPFGTEDACALSIIP